MKFSNRIFFFLLLIFGPSKAISIKGPDQINIKKDLITEIDNVTFNGLLNITLVYSQKYMIYMQCNAKKVLIELLFNKYNMIIKNLNELFLCYKDQLNNINEKFESLNNKKYNEKYISPIIIIIAEKLVTENKKRYKNLNPVKFTRQFSYDLKNFIIRKMTYNGIFNFEKFNIVISTKDLIEIIDTYLKGYALIYFYLVQLDKSL